MITAFDLNIKYGDVFRDKNDDEVVMFVADRTWLALGYKGEEFYGDMDIVNDRTPLDEPEHWERVREVR